MSTSEKKLEAMSVGGNDNVLFAYLPNGKLFVLKNENKSVNDLKWSELNNEMENGFRPKMYFNDGILIGFVEGNDKTYVYNGVGSQWKECKSEVYDTQNSLVSTSKPTSCGRWSNIFTMDDKENSTWIYTDTNNIAKLKIKKG